MIPIAKPYLDKKEAQYAYDTILTGWVTQGPKVQEFEEKFAAYVGSKYAVALSNCTTALHLSMLVAGVNEDDEVICPSMSYVATANAIRYVGAKVVFAEVNPITYNIDIEDVQKKITPKTKAILIVHQIGMPADIDAFKQLCNEHHLVLIEDAACAVGASYKGNKIGSHSDLVCFSFHPRKVITTGDGGMVTTNNEVYRDKIKLLRQHGMSVNDRIRHESNKVIFEDHIVVGYNYRMTDIQASIGTTQMDRAEEIHRQRTNIADKYDKLIDNISWLKKPFRNNEYEHGFQAYVCMFSPEEINSGNIEKINKMRNDFMDHLQQNGISTRPGTHSVHMLEYYKNKYGFKNNDFINSYITSECSIAFPLFPTLKDEEFNYISDKISNYKL